jgi:putative acetyltransferase
MNSKITIRLEKKSDHAVVSQVIREAFGKQDTLNKENTLKFVERVRSEDNVCLSMIATDQGIVGHIIFAVLPLTIDGRSVRAAYLASVAVATTHQGKGIGSSLIRIGLEELRKKDFEAIVVLGYPTYYPRFGFSAKIAKKIKAPFEGSAFMALELTPGALKGKVGVADFHPLYTASYSESDI